MPLFDAPVPRRLLWPLNAPWPRRRVREIIRRFQLCYPSLDYDVDSEVGIANAQAFLEGGRRCIRLYGGLTRHRKVGASALAVVLAHETGHHLAGPPFLPYYRWLSSEERATEWARDVGLPAVFGAKAAKALIFRGEKQLRVAGLSV